MAGKHYVVWKGRTPGIYADWASAKAQIDGFDGARYKGFPTRELAEAAYATEPAPLPAFLTHRRTELRPETDRPLDSAIAVDAACSGNPGVMEYRGVSLWDRKVIFHHKYEVGTNNIGEFLAIVEGLARLKSAGSTDVTIYSDSMIAIGWVRQGKCRTKLEPTPRTAQLLDVVRRAEAWLKANGAENPIVKWPTDLWGEIPADFGRK
ncbi:MAG: viroplasmin family protein [Marinilabiliaceae bacterium]